ncbi:hypothetical protein K502DRAFT_367470 [Neoconidiobolus thromboides FSU 785]|nr:hypothetical protein K502DRAFT_367470 [Neoconidiobolus thromboides FSU 785]
MVRQALIRHFKVAHLHPERPIKSNFISTRTLLVIRSILTLYCIAAVIVLFIKNKAIPITYFVFLTHLSYFGITVYFIITTYFTLRSYLHAPTYVPFNNIHWSFRFIYSLLFQSIMLLAPVVTIVYWSLLFPNDTKLKTDPVYAYQSISMHALNLVFCWIELILCCNMFVFWHFIPLIVILYLYLPMAILVHKIHGFWIYPFLNYIDYPITFTVVVIALLVLAVVLQLIYCYVYKLRDRKGRYDHSFDNIEKEPYESNQNDMNMTQV